MDIFEMLEILVDLKSISNKKSDSKLEELKKRMKRKLLQ